jgi:hypothetical protein
MSFTSRASRLKHELRRSGRIETPMVFINDPEEGLEMYKLPESVLNSGRTIEIGGLTPGHRPLAVTEEDGGEGIHHGLVSLARRRRVRQLGGPARGLSRPSDSPPVSYRSQSLKRAPARLL